jgi:molybdate transport system substrate-binding protein
MKLTVLALAALAFSAMKTEAAEIRVVSTLNIRPALDDLVGPYERATGNRVVFQSQGAAATEALIERGVAGDLAVHARPTLERLLHAKKVLGPVTDISHSSIGVVVRAGAAKPDISSDDAFRRVLLDAKSLTYPDPKKGSLGGNYLAHLFREWGIAKALAPKLTLAAGGAPAGELVAAGKAEYGMNQIAEIMKVKGVEFLAPLPPALTNKVVMGAALLPQAKNAEAARSFIAFLKSPAAAQAIAAHGMTP